MTKKQRYTLEFKQEAVKLVTEQGYTQAQAARNLGMSCKNISRWIRELKGQAKTKLKLESSDEQAELKRLRKENQRLKQERDILKKAAAFFANESS